MKNIIKMVCGVVVPLTVLTALGRELRTPIDFFPDVLRESRFLDNEHRTGGVGVFGRGFYRTAQDAFCCCHGTSTEPLSALWFNKSDFQGSEIFAQGVLPTPDNIWLVIATMSPRFRYTQRGAVMGMMVSKRVHDDKVRIGFRADVPVSIIDVDRLEKCGDKSLSLGGETINDVVVYKPEVENDLNGTPRGLLNFAYRLDFLSALPLGVIGLSASMPFVNYHNTAFVGAPITIANQNVTDNATPDSGAFVVRSDNGVPSGQFYQLETYYANPVTANGSGLLDGQYGYWANGTDYSPLASDLAAQKNLWIIPAVVQRANAVDQRAESMIIQDKLKQLLTLLGTSAEEFFARKQVCFNSQRSVGLGDLQLEFFTNYIPSEKTYIEGVLGLLVPTAQKIDNPQLILKMPLGNNGHVETKLAFYAAWMPLKWLNFKADAAYSFVLPAQENVAAAFQGAAIKNINPTTRAKVSWGYFVGDFNLTFLNQENTRLGLTLGYQFYAKQKDKVCFCTTKASDFMGVAQDLNPAVLACRTNVMSHKGRVELFCQTNACELSVEFQHAFAGKNAFKETSLLLGLSVGF